MILISGATGFLGTHLLKKLCDEGHLPVRAIYRSENKKNYTLRFLNMVCSGKGKTNIQNIEWIKADILDIPELDLAFKDVQFVYHCAAWVGNSPNQSSKMRKVNIEGTANMVNMALAHKVSKFCHVSSIATLGVYLNSNKVDENAPRESERFSSIYSISKYGAEMEVWRASQEGLSIVIVNPGVILGAGFLDSASGQIFKRVLNNSKFYINKKTGFVYVEDVVSFMLKLMQSSIANERYILTSENLSFKNVMHSIADTFQKKKPTIKATKLMLYIIWFFQQIKSIFKPLDFQVTLNAIRRSDSKLEYQNDKSKDAFIFEYTPIKDAIQLIYRDHQLLQNQ
jgi:nucleoside-diphosphate-sugar epimerase